jgi:hypothetical protein
MDKLLKLRFSEHCKFSFLNSLNEESQADSGLICFSTLLSFLTPSTKSERFLSFFAPTQFPSFLSNLERSFRCNDE